MKHDVWYVVTKGNDTFEVGDHIYLELDDTVLCREAGGWLNVTDVPEAILGMECAVDKAWVEARKQSLLKEVERMRELCTD